MNNNSNYNNINFPCQNDMYRSKGPEKKGKKKLTFKCMKNNTISSLKEVECFLTKMQQVFRCAKLYKLLK